MIIKTRKLPATQGDSERMRATADNGASLTIPYPYCTDDPAEYVMIGLAQALRRDPVSPFSVTRVGDNRWEVGFYHE